MEEDMRELEPASEVIKNNQCKNTNDIDHPKTHNFSIESILSSDSSALALASTHETKRSYENKFDLHSHLFRKGIEISNNEEETNESEKETKYDINTENNCIDDEDEDVDVESRSPSPTSHPDSSSIFDIGQTNRNLPMFGLSRGNS